MKLQKEKGTRKKQRKGERTLAFSTTLKVHAARFPNYICFVFRSAQKECCAKYGSATYEKFLQCFCALPVCATLAQEGKQKR